MLFTQVITQNQNNATPECPPCALAKCLPLLVQGEKKGTLTRLGPLARADVA